MVRMWIRSKKSGDHVQGDSASSISNLTLGGTLGVLVAVVVRNGVMGTYQVGCIGLRSVAVTVPLAIIY
jgi:hypothetical protein